VSGRLWGRAAGVFGLVLALLIGISGAAMASTPTPPAVSKDATAIADWPLPLQQLVVGTAAFQKGPWFTDPSCKDKGGNVGLYINTYMAHEREFMLQLAKSVAPGNADAKAFIDAAGGTNKFQTWPGDDPRVASFTMPTKKACADRLAQWGVPDSASVWGFNWTAAPDATSAKTMQDAATSMQTKDDLDPMNVEKWGQNADTDYIKAHAFFFDCDKADPKDKSFCRGWNLESETLMIGADAWKQAQKSFWDKAGLFFKMVGFGIITSPTWVGVACGFVLTMVGKVLGAVVDYAAKKGMDQVVAFFTGALVTLWGAFTSWMVNFTTPNLLAGGFVDTYNLISGVMLGLAFLGWLAALALAWKRGRLATSIWGALKAVLGIQLVGVFAYFMLTLARQATTLLIAGHVESIQSAKFATSLVAVNPAVGLLAAAFGILGLLCAFIVLIFQIPLVFGYALFGTVAAAGSVHPASSGWLTKWFFNFLSLCWTPFFMVGLSILGQDLVSGLDSNTTQNVGQQMATVLGGLLIMVLLPTTPWLLSSVMSFTTGRVSAAADSLGEKFGSQALSAGSGAAQDGASAAGRALRAGAGDTWGALATMGSNLVSMAAGNAVGSDGDSKSSSGSGTGAGPATDAAGAADGGSAGELLSSGQAAKAAGSGAGAGAGAGAAAAGPAGMAVAAGKALVGNAAEMAQAGAGAEEESSAQERGDSAALGGQPATGDERDTAAGGGEAAGEGSERDRAVAGPAAAMGEEEQAAGPAAAMGEEEQAVAGNEQGMAEYGAVEPAAVGDAQGIDGNGIGEPVESAAATAPAETGAFEPAQQSTLGNGGADLRGGTPTSDGASSIAGGNGDQPADQSAISTVSGGHEPAATAPSGAGGEAGAGATPVSGGDAPAATAADSGAAAALGAAETQTDTPPGDPGRHHVAGTDMPPSSPTSGGIDVGTAAPVGSPTGAGVDAGPVVPVSSPTGGGVDAGAAAPAPAAAPAYSPWWNPDLFPQSGVTGRAVAGSADPVRVDQDVTDSPVLDSGSSAAPPAPRDPPTQPSPAPASGGAAPASSRDGSRSNSSAGGAGDQSILRGVRDRD